jgi:hypothetical protein
MLAPQPAAVRSIPTLWNRHWCVRTPPESHGDGGGLLGTPARSGLVPPGKRTNTAEVSAMRVNIWLVLAVLIALFGITRYTRHQHTHHCLDQPDSPRVRTVTYQREHISCLKTAAICVSLAPHLHLDFVPGPCPASAGLFIPLTKARSLSLTSHRSTAIAGAGLPR